MWPARPRSNASRARARWEYSRDNRANYAMIDQFLNRGELLSACFDDERHAAYAILGGSFFGNFARVEIFGLFGRRNDDSPVSNDPPRALQRVASDHITIIAARWRTTGTSGTQLDRPTPSREQILRISFKRCPAN
jgi:hypothetical protein